MTKEKESGMTKEKESGMTENSDFVQSKQQDIRMSACGKRKSRFNSMSTNADHQ